jgi:hypothetical protein
MEGTGMEENHKSGLMPQVKENPAKIADDYVELGQEDTEEGITIDIPEGRIGELRCAFKAGCDCMGIVYSRPDSDNVNVVGSCDQGTQTGDKAKHLFPSGVWNLWVYNRTRSRFEKMTKKSVTTENGKSSFVLGATHRVSPTQKTCIVCVMDMVPNR